MTFFVLSQDSVDYNSWKDKTIRSVNKTKNISRFICSLYLFIIKNNNAIIKIELYRSSSKNKVASIL